MEIYVIDDPAAPGVRVSGTNPCGCACNRGGVCAGCGHPGCAERQLELTTVRGFGDMAKSAFVALVMSLGRGRSERELDRAMNPPATADWVKKGSLHSHISAVRRSGLRIRFESGRYQVIDLRPDQVDALAFRQVRERVRALESGSQDDGTRAETVELCRQVSPLWVEDPAEAHPYVRDERIFAGDKRRYAALKAAYARALLGSPGADRSSLAEASEAIEELQRLGSDPSELRDLMERIRRHQVPVSSASPRAFSPPTVPETGSGRPSWLKEYREYVADLAESIDLRPFGSEILSQSSLEAVYTPLYVKPRSLEPPVVQGQAEVSRPTLDTVADEAPRLLVIGESGSGKSTFLRHLCLRALRDENGAVPLFLELIELSDLAERELSDRGGLSWDLVPRVFVDRLVAEGIHATVEDVERLSSGGQALWLLDGLNEISAPDVRGAVSDVLSRCARRWRGSRFVVTSTEAALAIHGAPLGLMRVHVDDLREQDVEDFLEAFAADFYPELDDEERMERWEPLATKVLAAPDLRDLARIPLHLTAMAVIYFSEGWLPESRADLLRAAVSWSIRKRAQVLRSFVRRGRELETVFAELAFRMVAGAEQPLAKAGKRWAAEQIARLRLPSFDGDVERSGEFLEAATSSGGLLVSRGPGDLGMHEAFRNYLAASCIAGKTDDQESGWWAVLEPHLDDPDWRHILTLVPGCLLALGSDRVDLFFDRLGRSCLGRPLQVRAARIALGGSVLRELALAGYRPGRVSRWHEAARSMRELFRSGDTVPLEVRYEAAVAYGLTGDDRLDDFDASWAWLEGGRFLMGAQAEDPAGPNYDPDAAPWEAPVRPVMVKPFGIRRYPVTVREYQAFVETGGYTETGNRWWSREALQWRVSSGVSAPLEWDDQLLVPNAPVSGVSWLECEAYCHWRTEQAGGDMAFRLPQESEWEFAARRGVPPGRQFTWGNRMRVDRAAEANWIGAFLRRKTPVGLFPRSTTPDGVADMFGNVEEWCQDVWEFAEEEVLVQRASRMKLARAAIERSAARRSGRGVRRVVRGGSCVRFSRLCRPTYRSRIDQYRRYLTVGFRMVSVRSSAATEAGGATQRSWTGS